MQKGRRREAARGIPGQDRTLVEQRCQGNWAKATLNISSFMLICTLALTQPEPTHTQLSSPRVLRHGIVGVACQAAQPVWAAQQWQPVQASDQGNCSPCNQKKTLPLAARRLLLLQLLLLLLLRLHLGLANVFSGSGSGSGGTCCELFTATGGLRFLRREAGAGRSSSLCGHYTAPEAFECVYVEASIAQAQPSHPSNN